jgi:hypothetical protein
MKMSQNDTQQNLEKLKTKISDEAERFDIAIAAAHPCCRVPRTA